MSGVHHMIVGNSVAGIEAAIALRTRDADARITIVGDEHDHFYARTALMYVLCGQLSVRDTEPYDRELYARLRFTRVRDRVTRVRAADHALDLASGGALAYDRLLLAVGSTARRLPWPGAYEPTPSGAPPSVHHFVTLRDLEALDRAAKPGQSVAVVGGGLIGVEVAEVLHQRGLKVHFLVREPWYFPIALDEAEATVVATHIRHHGLDVRLDATVEGMTHRDGRIGLAVGAEELVVDHVVAAIGVVPNTAFLSGGGVALSDGGAIETDDGLRSTSAADVWAAGDCANVTWHDGARRPEQLWYTARDQGRFAARSMLGDGGAYRRGTWYNSAKFFDIEYTTAGWIPYPAPAVSGAAAPPQGYRTWFQHVPGGAVTQRIVCKGDRVVGFNCLGSRWDHALFLRWIQERRPLAWVLDNMDKARFDEEFMPPFRVLPTATLTPGA
jgi:NADPH-dependent 2,4-dienoyl-CoA reductase/sulfur reductase-like enzyme